VEHDKTGGMNSSDSRIKTSSIFLIYKTKIGKPDTHKTQHSPFSTYTCCSDTLLYSGSQLHQHLKLIKI
jgi:hypothetical protein